MSEGKTQKTHTGRKLRKSPKKKVVYIELDDEITTIFDSVRRLPNKHIYIMAPRRASLFHSIVNLKILKKKFEDHDKVLHIVTKDPVGLKLAKQAGITSFEKLDADLITTHIKSKKSGSEPIAAVSNEKFDDDPKRRKSRKMSIIEVVKKTRDGAQNKFGIMTNLEKIKNKMQSQPDTRVVLVTPNKRAFSTLVIASVGLFILIAYFALPGATIELTTSPNILQRSINITLADAKRNARALKNSSSNMVATYPISVSVDTEISYTSTGQNFEGSNASGEITIINKSDHSWPLVKKTRFQTEEGLVFRIKEDVTVPASREVEKTREDGTTYTDTVPGELQTRVVADTEDAFGIVIGKRGNIEPTNFIVPGLSKSSQNLLYAESSEAFTGGQTSSSPRVVAEDIEAAKEKLVEELKSTALDALHDQVEKDNQEKNTNLKLMEDSFVLDFEEPTFNIPSDVIGQELQEFNISGSIDVTGVAYNFNEIMNMLREDLQLHKSPEKRLVYIYDQSFGYDIVDIDEQSDTVKITASIKGIEEFDIDPKSEHGRRLAKKIKEHIVGKNKKEAASYIQNLPEINKVSIKTWPGWAPNLPAVPENIEIKVIQGEAVEIENEDDTL